MAVRALRPGLLSAGLVLAIVAASASTDSLGPGLAVVDAIVGVVAWDRRADSGTGPLMILAGFAWLMGSLASVALFWQRPGRR